MDEDIRGKKDVGGELLAMRLHVEEKESLFSIVGDPDSLMNWQEKSTTSRSVLKMINISKNVVYDALKCQICS